ncbi:Calmodulin-like protein 5 [Mortierella sp. AD032]|nr:Calmodulin-like protein 5 [Mortierella sp. AD032]
MSATSALTPEQLLDLQESFSAFDRNGDGTINKSELRGLLHTVGHKVDSEGLASLLKEFDNDQSEAIDFQEFVALADRITKNKVSN